MAGIPYKPLFQIELYHNYFENGLGNNAMRLIPTKTTKALFQNFNILFKTLEATTILYAGTNASIADFLLQLENKTAIHYFEFTLEIMDPNFYNYTNLPIKENFSYLFESDNEDNKINSIGMHLKAVEIENGESFGNVRIYFKDIIKFQSEIPSYNIRFKARATRWDYFIINQSERNNEGLAIETHEDFDFRGPFEVLIANGQKAFLFTSGRELVLSEIPKYNFHLTASENGNFKIVSKGLPIPNTTNIMVYEENGIKELSSSIYIYI